MQFSKDDCTNFSDPKLAYIELAISVLLAADDSGIVDALKEIEPTDESEDARWAALNRLTDLTHELDLLSPDLAFGVRANGLIGVVEASNG